MTADRQTTVTGTERGKYHLISVDGDFTIQTLAMVREKVEEALAKECPFLAFHLAKTKVIDSSAIGLIANANQKLVERGGSAYLVGISLSIEEVIKTTEITRVIPQLDDLAEADKDIG